MNAAPIRGSVTVTKPMWKALADAESAPIRYGVGALSAILAIIARALLTPLIGDKAPFATVVLAILFSAAIGGSGPAFLALGLGIVAAVWGMIPAGLWDTATAVNDGGTKTLAFSVVGGCIALVGGKMRAARRDAQAASKAISKQREQLADISSRLEAALDAGATATWTWDIRNNRVLGDKNLIRLFSGSSDDVSNWPLEKFFAAIHPDDQQRIFTVATRAIEAAGDYEVDFRVLQADGTVRWVVSRGRAERDEQGHVQRMSGLLVDITARKLAEEALRKSEEQLRSLTQATPGIVWTNLPDGRVDHINQQWFDLTGQTAEQFYHSASGWLDAVHPDDRQRSADTYQQAVAAGESYELETRFRRISDGSYRWYLNRAVPVRDAQGAVVKYVGTCTDIEDYRRVEANLVRVTEQSEQQRRVYETALSSTPDLIYVFDLNGRFTYANQALLSLWRRTWTDAIGKNCLELGYPPEHAAMHDREIRQVIETRQPIRGEIPFDGAHGLRIYEYIFVPVIGATGEVEAVAGSTRDTTERRKLEDNLRKLADDLSVADRRKDEFLATLAHELRNPLAPIRHALELMRLTDESSALEQSRAIMERQVSQMVRLVDDLLDVSRITRNRLELRQDRVELSTVLASALETSRPLVEESRHQLTVVLPEQAIYLSADETRLAQVFSNLLNNGAKYTQPGGHLWLTAETENHEVVVRVRDTGIGIAPESLPRVFEMFAQVDGSLERAQGGLGIGLTLVKRLVAMHGGSVEAKSEGLNKGSEFIVRLPILLEAPSLAPEPTMKNGKNGNAAGGKRKILVVDDNIDSANTLTTLLAMLGNEICTAHDGGEAVAKAATFRPEIILLDLGLPNPNGFEACRLIRKQPGTENVVIVALTGWGQEEDRYRTKEAGFDHHFVKPIDLAVLQQLIAGLPKHRVPEHGLP